MFSVRKGCQLHEGSGEGWQLQECGLGCHWVIFFGEAIRDILKGGISFTLGGF